ncbi:mannose-6-phosphate isomerase, class I [Salinicoccus halodurans]|uniref:Mannose-6-phosphate isomerase n=1 Tax=Salinicoccus halodurans TaxID=407035 RepID=A0A0F7HPB2_9STAP|nr:mannose-6-phosphate isomerase, class I [Salinicoccus halodurans]AKG74998.1 mannose-6-phosphate isomerase [Salinicoccus halodurans]SFK67182.1 mannose-6-phosphate isomerase, type 1 [Salinicoccus halodurans]
MFKEPIFLEPVLQERIWGGTKLREEYGYEIPSETTGEAWVVSAHPNGASRVSRGKLEGKTLDQLWKNRGELFNKKSDGEYPLLVKILDAADDLSVQVHPDDRYAQEVEGVPYGKTECWYVLDAEQGANLILGHTAADKAGFEKMVNQGEWEQLFRYVKVQKGDFVYVPSGTIHAIGRGITILEVQQSSDITYRVYDYDRKDKAGNTRELHLDKAKAVTQIPHEDVPLSFETMENGDLKIRQLVKEHYFTVEKWEVSGKAGHRVTADFLQVNVLEGKGSIEAEGEKYDLAKGIHFILPNGVRDIKLDGEMELIVSHP